MRDQELNQLKQVHQNNFNEFIIFYLFLAISHPPSAVLSKWNVLPWNFQTYCVIFPSVGNLVNKSLIVVQIIP